MAALDPLPGMAELDIGACEYAPASDAGAQAQAAGAVDRHDHLVRLRMDGSHPNRRSSSGTGIVRFPTSRVMVMCESEMRLELATKVYPSVALVVGALMPRARGKDIVRHPAGHLRIVLLEEPRHESCAWSFSR